jgi:hypothetical protein
MTEPSKPPEQPSPPGSDAEEAIVRAVKSRILEQLAESLGRDEVVRSRASHYTKSDSGLYGKYEKYEEAKEQILEVVRQQLDSLLAEFTSDTRPALEEASPSAGEASPSVGEASPSAGGTLPTLGDTPPRLGDAPP